ncbi:MAG: crossover junction endodeoxyribonuclease RuvC [Actinobacteria bacterium]|nr:crossover junction endodeoxyribonuclease RuvC [Actinomycetota bacterium]
MKILGVDPGLTRCGYGVIESEGLKLIDFGLFTSAAGTDPRDRVGEIAAGLKAVLDAHKPDAIALERVFAQANLRSVMGVAQISGALMHLAFERSIPLQFFTPSEVKAAVTGNGRADKAQVGQMVARLVKKEIPGPPDIADAIAVAICGSKRGGGAGTAAQNKWVAAAKAANRRIG